MGFRQFLNVIWADISRSMVRKIKESRFDLSVYRT